MTIQRLDNVGVVVEELAVVTEFFVDLGLEKLGDGPVEGDWVDRVVGLAGAWTSRCSRPRTATDDSNR